MKKLAITLSALLPLTASASVTVNNAWIRSSTGPNGALFLDLENNSSQLDELVSASCPQEVCDHMELHTHLHENGKMMMRQVDSIEVKENSKTQLKPGGLHVMFMGLKKPLLEGDTIPVHFEFKTGESVDLDVAVKSAASHHSQ